MQQLSAWAKRLSSYLKRDWEVNDYPLRFRRQEAEGADWHVQIVNWWQLCGLGETKQQAVANLEEHLSVYREIHGSLPRPGTVVPLESASAGAVLAHESLAREYLAKVLDLDYDRCFISDQSSLWDFETSGSIEEFLAKTQKNFGVDVSDVAGANLERIFERIDTCRPSG